MKKLLLLLMFAITLIFAKVDINTASKDELMSLKGIGSATADKIIEYRKTNKFNKIDELKNVKGIGEKKFEVIKNDISVDNTKVNKEADKSKNMKR